MLLLSYTSKSAYRKFAKTHLTTKLNEIKKAAKDVKEELANYMESLKKWRKIQNETLKMKHSLSQIKNSNNNNKTNS
jgi:vacuolar-type H+-ATPase catalytic subunit A/Vma1